MLVISDDSRKIRGMRTGPDGAMTFKLELYIIFLIIMIIVRFFNRGFITTGWIPNRTDIITPRNQ